MQSNTQNRTVADLDVAVNDLGPLAWVLDELRKSLDGAAKALKRFVRDAEAAVGSDLAALDASQLRIARQQLHQAVGALEMVGLAEPALVLRAMEAAVQKFVQQPEQCTQDAAARIERASFALSEYLEGVLADKPISPVSLFPQYREVQELVRADRIHPADLWPCEWRWIEPEFPATAQPQAYGAGARALFDQCVLQIMKGSAPNAASQLKDVSLGFAAGQADRQSRIFWKVAAAYFEALACNLLPPDIYVRRAASRILLQYASLSKGDNSISDRLAHDLLFFCSQAIAARATDTPVLSAVRSAYGLARFKPVDYEAIQFGRFDPALLAQARKRIVSAKETWSSLSAGDTSKFKVVVDQFSLVADSLVKLHPPSEPMAQALARAIDVTARSGQAPSIGLAMEVATSVLYLEAAFDDLDPNDPQLAVRTKHLADRLEGVRRGGDPQPLETWMEELYRHVSDKQTMGSVVGELRISLGELEKSLDSFFRNPQDKTVLRDVPSQLSQMRGVLSVLGLEQASQAVLRMRDSVEQMLVTEVDQQLARAAGTFDQLGNNLGALSFLIDMLNYQPVLAKKLFIYDEAKGELRPLMGRTQKVADAESVSTSGELLSEEVSAVVHNADAGASAQKLTEQLDTLVSHAALAGQAGLAKTAHDAAVAVAVAGQNSEAASSAISALVVSAAVAVPASAAPADDADFEEDDLRDIFLDEAREVTANGQLAIQALAGNPGDIGQLTILRRVFHTLKGSSRMVGLNEFGEAAWSVEQLFNSWLAEQKPASEELRALSSDALKCFSVWIEDIAGNRDGAWAASAFRTSADAMRSDGRFIALQLPAKSLEEPATVAPPASHDPGILDVPASDASVLHADAPQPEVAVSDVDFDDFFDSPPLAVAAAPTEVAPHEIQGIDFESLADLGGETSVIAKAPEAVSPVFPEFSLEPDTQDEALVARQEAAAGTAEAPELSEAFFDEEFFSLADASTAPAEGAQALGIPDEPVSGSPTDIEADSAIEATAAADDQIKAIGALRIGLPLYNVYLNEADEWSRRLVTEIAEWALEHENPVPDSTVALAHSLAGSSATVGFEALSEIARALEHALQQSQAHHSSNAAAVYGPVFVDASEDIRRLLHQFAAGFLKGPDLAVLSQLRELDFSDPVSVLPVESRISGLDMDFLDEPVAPEVDDLIQISLPAAAAPVIEPEAEKVPAPALLETPVREAPVVALFSSSPESFAAAEDDEIDAVDAIDPELFPIFDEEAAELMPQLGGALRQWSARPDNAGARMEVLRARCTRSRAVRGLRVPCALAKWPTKSSLRLNIWARKPQRRRTSSHC